MRHPSKRDPGRVRSLGRTSLAFLAAGVLSAVAALRIDALFVVSIVCVGMSLAVAWMLRTTDYEIGAGRLRIRCGAARTSIPLDAIERVSPSDETWNAPALSFDRLRIDYRRRGRPASVLVSPLDAVLFLNELGVAAGLIHAVGALVRTPAAPGDASNVD